MAVVNFVLSLLAALTSMACMVLLLRAYAASGLRLLLWSGLCFVFLSLSNLLLFFDLAVFTDLDLRPYRVVAALVAILFLLYGFIWEAE
ncbi:MAG TPA: DUF5985 family protein [Burkholderiales bacterium]